MQYAFLVSFKEETVQDRKLGLSDNPYLEFGNIIQEALTQRVRHVEGEG
jgi:hypothetical protein